MLNIYLTNLGKYNEGELIGEWVSLPIGEEELNEVLDRIGISEEPDENGNYYEECFITDFENDFGYSVYEYESIEELNEIAKDFESRLSAGATADIVKALIEEGGYSIWEALNAADDCIIHADCWDLAGVAEKFYYETGLINDVPEELRTYIDWEAVGRDMDLNGELYYMGCGDYLEVLR